MGPMRLMGLIGVIGVIGLIMFMDLFSLFCIAQGDVVGIVVVLDKVLP